MEPRSTGDSQGRTNRSHSDAADFLIGIPEPIGFESPASWLARAALSQGVSPKELLAHFGFHKKVDPDLFMTGKAAMRISVVCQLPLGKFDFAVRMFDNLKSIDPTGEIFLLERKQLAEYRYCPVCLHLSRTKHFMVHWRFRAWRHCPLHRCMMEDSCPRCGSLVQLPTDLMNAGPEKQGIAFLDQCGVCGHKLSRHWDQVWGLVDQYSVSDWKWSQLVNGRATLSAIYHRELRYAQGSDGTHGLRDLLKLDRRGLIPNRSVSGEK